MNILETLQRLLMDSGFVGFFMDGGWKNLIMIAVACLLLYLGIVKKFAAGWHCFWLLAGKCIELLCRWCKFRKCLVSSRTLECILG